MRPLTPGDTMRWSWIAGAAHGLVGTAVLFGTLHPLRDMLDAHALDLARVGSATQIGQGLALMLLARTPASTIPAVLIAIGTTLWSAMLYVIVFTGQHPFDPVVPAGGAIMLLGWVALLFTRPGQS